VGVRGTPRSYIWLAPKALLIAAWGIAQEIQSYLWASAESATQLME